MKGDWNASVATKHTKDCHRQFNWLNPKTLAVSLYMYERQVREAFKINKLRTLKKDITFKFLNTDIWNNLPNSLKTTEDLNT